ncbi:MAG TPA: ribosome maturation factor RimP [Lachnospiraceae bacterium]|nr:ribosome maturation factor RimP [Lachnospiraceae bacterium]
MSKREDIEKKTEELVMPILDENGFDLVDTEYVKEGENHYLRMYIDKPGGITIDDCETVSRAFSPILDKEDYIEDNYIMEVSSPGLLRPIKKPKDFERNLDKEVEVKLYKARDKKKEFIGVLKSYDSEGFVIDEDGTEVSFNKKEVSSLRPYINFGDL